MATQPYRNAFITNLGSIPSTGSTYDLGDFQIGVFDARTYQAVTAPSYPTNNAIIIAWGRDARSFPMGIGLTNETPKSLPIKASSIKSWVGNKSQAPQNMIVRIGYDGVDATKTLSLQEGKDMNFYLTLSGAPIGNLLGASSTTHYNTLTEAFTIQLPCTDECADNCGALVDCNVVADAMIDAISKRKTIGGELLSKYVRASKVVSCDTPSGYATVDCTEFTLVVADAGNQEALGRVQAQYIGTAVSRLSRSGIYSTYKLVVCDSSTPTAFDSSVTPTIPNCTTCPSGYTLVDGLYAYTVTRTDDGTPTALATFKTNYTATAEENTAIRLSRAFGTSTYEIYSTSATLAAATAGDVVTLLGDVQAVCTQDTATSIAWTEGVTCTRALQSYSISLKNNVCGDGFLTELQAAYNGIGTVTQGTTNTGTCTTQYFIEIESDNVYCDDCSDPTYTFTAPQPFNGSIWTLVATDVTGVGCVCGVQLESAYVQRDRKECFFEAVSYEVEPLFISVSSKNPNDMDYSELCSSDFPVTVVQGVKYAKGYGSSVLSERVVLSNFYFNRNWNSDPATRDAMGYELGIDLQGYYDEYVLTYTSEVGNSGMASGFGHSQFEEHSLTVYFPAGQGSSFVNAINAFVSFPGSIVSPIVI
jgi:hypothetical protein